MNQKTYIQKNLKEFIDEISDYWDKDELRKIATKHFGKELMEK